MTLPTATCIKTQLLTHRVCYALKVVLDVGSLNVFGFVEWRVASPVGTMRRKSLLIIWVTVCITVHGISIVSDGNMD